MNKEKAIDALNELIVINNDRIEGYETAIEETNEQDLKGLFPGMIQCSQNCKNELINEVKQMGGHPDEGTKNTGKIYRIWMDLKAALTNKDRKAVLNSCEFGEDVAKGTYEKVLEQENEHLSNEHRTLIKAQDSKLKMDHDKIKTLRDAL